MGSAPSSRSRSVVAAATTATAGKSHKLANKESKAKGDAAPAASLTLLATVGKAREHANKGRKSKCDAAPAAGPTMLPDRLNKSSYSDATSGSDKSALVSDGKNVQAPRKSKLSRMRVDPIEIPEEPCADTEEQLPCEACGMRRKVVRYSGEGSCLLCAACWLSADEGSLQQRPARGRRRSLQGPPGAALRQGSPATTLPASRSCQKPQALPQQVCHAPKAPQHEDFGLAAGRNLVRAASEPSLQRQGSPFSGSTVAAGLDLASTKDGFGKTAGQARGHSQPASRPTSATSRQSAQSIQSAPSTFGRSQDMELWSHLPQRPSSAAFGRNLRTFSHLPDYNDALPAGFAELHARKFDSGPLTEHPATPTPSSPAVRRAERRSQSKSLLERRPRSNMLRRRYSACCT